MISHAEAPNEVVITPQIYGNHNFDVYAQCVNIKMSFSHKGSIKHMKNRGYKTTTSLSMNAIAPTSDANATTLSQLFMQLQLPMI